MLYINATILTVNASREIIANGALYVHDSVIKDIGKATTLLSRYPAECTYNLNGHIVIPGLVCTHLHTVQTLLRGTADNLPLGDWLHQRILPLQRTLTEGDAAAAVRLTIAGLLKNGTTCFLESMFFAEHNYNTLCEIVQETGIRGCLGHAVGCPNNHRNRLEQSREKDTDDVEIRQCLDAYSKWNGQANGRIRVWFGITMPKLANPDLIRTTTSLSTTENIPVTIHFAETSQNADYMSTECGSPVKFGQSVGLVRSGNSDQATLPPVVLAHAVHLRASREEECVLANSNSHISHCPTSNAKLASGICSAASLLGSGVNISLGVDGAPCHNSLDMLSEMRNAVLVQRLQSDQASALDAETALEMATIRGANALGLGELIGSLEIGKRADFVAIAGRGLHCAPGSEWDPVSTVVYCAGREDVRTVVVDGVLLVDNGQLLTMNEEEIINEASMRGPEAVKRAGLGACVRGKWPLV